MLKGRCSSNCLFSPNFERFIDFDYSGSKFVIRDTVTEKIRVLKDDALDVILKLKEIDGQF